MLPGELIQLAGAMKARYELDTTELSDMQSRREDAGNSLGALTTVQWNLFELAAFLGWSEAEQEQLKKTYTVALGFDRSFDTKIVD